MELTTLFEVQRKLDAEIEKKHPRMPDEDRLAKRVLALLVELGELANEWRGFKFWSTNQQPRIEEWQPFTNPMRGEGGTMKNPLLEEYVDCLHFILSIAIEIGLDESPHLMHQFAEDKTIVEMFIQTTTFVSDLFWSIESFDETAESFHEQFMFFRGIMGSFVKLGEMLGFTWDQIESAYMSKNQTNWERQANGY